MLFVDLTKKHKGVTFLADICMCVGVPLQVEQHGTVVDDISGYVTGLAVQILIDVSHVVARHIPAYR